MAAGLSDKQKYRIEYRTLKRVQRLLADAGVIASYRKRVLTVPAFGSVYIAWSHASNGEVMGRLTAREGRVLPDLLGPQAERFRYYNGTASELVAIITRQLARNWANPLCQSDKVGGPDARAVVCPVR